MVSTHLILTVGVSKSEGFPHILLTERAIALTVTARAQLHLSIRARSDAAKHSRTSER